MKTIKHQSRCNQNITHIKIWIFEFHPGNGDMYKIRHKNIHPIFSKLSTSTPSLYDGSLFQVHSYYRNIFIVIFIVIEDILLYITRYCKARQDMISHKHLIWEITLFTLKHNIPDLLLYRERNIIEGCLHRSLSVFDFIRVLFISVLIYTLQVFTDIF